MDAHIIASAVRVLHRQFPHMTVDGLAPNGGRAAAERDDLIEDVLAHCDQVAWCVEWLQLCSRTRLFNQTADTYTYKHEVERHKGEWVSHLSLLVAAKLEGFEVRQARTRPWAGEMKLGARRPGRWG